MQRSVILALSAVALGVLAPLACTQNFGQFDATAGGTSGTGGASTSVGGTPTGSSTSGSGSGGGSASCTDSQCADDNPCTKDLCDLATGACLHENVSSPQSSIDDANACTDDLCEDGLAKHKNLPAGTSCGTSNSTCDGAGHCIMGCTMASECPPVECQIATCVNQQCGTQPKAEGTPCNTGSGAGKCNAAGACVECLTNFDCTLGTVCMANKCTSICADGMKDGSETDVDCGGQCARCATGKKCNVNSDCQPEPCREGICNPCEDGTKDVNETDVDCGGNDCPGCDIGKACSKNSDCVNNACKGGICSN